MTRKKAPETQPKFAPGEFFDLLAKPSLPCSLTKLVIDAISPMLPSGQKRYDILSGRKVPLNREEVDKILKGNDKNPWRKSVQGEFFNLYPGVAHGGGRRRYIRLSAVVLAILCFTETVDRLLWNKVAPNPKRGLKALGKVTGVNQLEELLDALESDANGGPHD